MGQPGPQAMADHPPSGGGEPGELKHLSTPRKRDYSPSSGERTGKSPNPRGNNGPQAFMPLGGCKAAMGPTVVGPGSYQTHP